jgi:hypothetical protein
MNYLRNNSRVGAALIVLVVAAACSDLNRTPSEPATLPAESPSLSRTPDGMEVLRDARVHPTVAAAHAAHAARHRKSSDLYFHGGVSGIGVETAPQVYVVFWGSQWSNDPSGEAALVQNFLNGVGGSGWLNSVTQYCQSVSSGTIYCNGAGTAAGNTSGILVGVWFDNGSAAPSQPSQSNLATEAVNAAAHFGNTTASSNASAQYVIATAHGNNSSGFGTQYCAYHSSVASAYGNVAYTGPECRHHHRRRPRAGRDDHGPVPERRLARWQRRRERRQVRLDLVRPGCVGERQLQHGDVPGAVAVEQRLRCWERRVRIVVLSGWQKFKVREVPSGSASRGRNAPTTVPPPSR